MYNKVSEFLTEHVILQFSNLIYFLTLNEKQFKLGVFTDFSKAFDTVDHKIPINWKLEKHGIKTSVHRLV